MPLTAEILFGIAALFGLSMAVRSRKEKPLPIGVIAIHGILAGVGLIILSLFFLGAGEAHFLAVAFVCFLIAIGIGLSMFFRNLGDEEERPAGSRLFMHWFLALSGLLMLGLYVIFA